MLHIRSATATIWRRSDGVEGRHEARQQGLRQLGVLLDDVEVGSSGRPARQLDLQAEDADQRLGQPCHGVAGDTGQLQRGLVPQQVVVRAGEQPEAGRLVGGHMEVRIRRQSGRRHQAQGRGPVDARRGRHLAQGEWSPWSEGEVERQLPEVGRLRHLLGGGTPAHGVADQLALIALVLRIRVERPEAGRVVTVGLRRVLGHGTSLPDAPGRSGPGGAVRPGWAWRPASRGAASPSAA